MKKCPVRKTQTTQRRLCRWTPRVTSVCPSMQPSVQMCLRAQKLLPTATSLTCELGLYTQQLAFSHERCGCGHISDAGDIDLAPFWLHTGSQVDLLQEREDSKQQIYNKLCIYSYRFKLQSPSRCTPFDAIHLSRRFFHGSKQFLNLSMLMPFRASVVFWFHLFHISKTFPFEEFFHPEKQK